MGKIAYAAVWVTKKTDTTPSPFGYFMTKSKGKSRRSQTYRIKDDPVVIKKLTFSKDFYLAEVKVYGGEFSSRNRPNKVNNQSKFVI